MHEAVRMSHTKVERSDTMSKNVGRLDAYLRIAAGLSLISFGIMKKKGWMAVLGSFKVSTGVTRYCPMLDALQLSTVCEDELLEDYDCEYDDSDCDETCEDDCGCDDWNSNEYANYDEYYLAHQTAPGHSDLKYNPREHYHKNKM